MYCIIHYIALNSDNLVLLELGHSITEWQHIKQKQKNNKKNNLICSIKKKSQTVLFSY